MADAGMRQALLRVADLAPLDPSPAGVTRLVTEDAGRFRRLMQDPGIRAGQPPAQARISASPLAPDSASTNIRSAPVGMARRSGPASHTPASTPGSSASPARNSAMP